MPKFLDYVYSLLPHFRGPQRKPILTQGS
jgi:hypothetical protein